MLTVLVIAILLMVLCSGTLGLIIVLRGINLSLNINYNIPESKPLPTYTEVPQVDQEAEKAVVSAAQAIQRFFLDDTQMDIPGGNRNG